MEEKPVWPIGTLGLARPERGSRGLLRVADAAGALDTESEERALSFVRCHTECMSRAMDEPRKSPAELSPKERELLEDARHQLKEAVQNYDRFLGAELKPGMDAPVHKLEDMAATQAEIEAAEAELWRVRGELLGWRRPGWAQSATSVSDWFSDEDADYDDYPLSSST